VLGTYECGNEPAHSKNEGNFLSSWRLISFSGRTLLHGVSKSVNLLVKINNYGTVQHAWAFHQPFVLVKKILYCVQECVEIVEQGMTWNVVCCWKAFNVQFIE
jgi:hypothetical protein